MKEITFIQLYNCQIFHERVRKECIEFAKKNFNLFSEMVDEESLSCRLNDLENHMTVCGDVELDIISRRFK